MRRRLMPKKTRREGLCLSMDTRTVDLIVKITNTEGRTMGRVAERLILMGLWLYKKSNKALPTNEELEQIQIEGV